MGPRQRAPTLLQRREAQTRKGCESRPFEKKIQISDLAMGRIFMRDLIVNCGCSIARFFYQQACSMPNL